MKILTIAGTRPELIRLSIIISKLDTIISHTFVYTNQNYDKNLSDIFFDELGIRDPDYIFEHQDSFSNFMANAFVEFTKILDIEKPDKILILGDTNSGLLSIVAEKYNIPIYHMEAGNRCFNALVPEETNRKIIDNVSKFNLPYTENSKQNLLAEGFHKNFVFKTGNPIYEVLNYYEKECNSSNILSKLNLKKHEFVLVTAHRSENVDNFKSLANIIASINIISKQFKVVVSLHPRTKDKLKKFNIDVADNVFMLEPFGFFDFIKLEQNSEIVISDCLNPSSVILYQDGVIGTIDNLMESDFILGNNSYEIINAVESKEVLNKYRIRTKYNEVVCSENHKLFVGTNDGILEKKVKDITCKDKLVSFCNIDVDTQIQKLTKVDTVDYVNIDSKGIKIIKQKSLGDGLHQFGRFKCNTLYLKKGVSITKLKNVLKYLNIGLEFLNKYTYIRKNNERKRQVTIKQPTTLDVKLAELVGFLCGDGFLVNSRTSLYDQNIKNLEYFNRIFKSHFNIEGKFNKDKRNKCIALDVYSKNLFKFITTNFYTESQNTLTKKKDISDIICKSPNNVVAGYIRGLFEAEGFVGDHHFAITMSDKPVILKLKYLLLRFGILTNMYELEPKRKKDKSTLYQLNIYEHRSREIFKKEIGFISKYKKNNTKKLFNRIKEHKFKKPVERHDNLFFDLIRKIEVVKDSDSYIDLNVLPNNTFFVNGILSHNSGTCQEECCIFNVPSITIRDSTERQELIECGSTVLTGTDSDNIVNTFNVLINRKYKWTPPNDYLIENVSDTVINILLGKK